MIKVTTNKPGSIKGKGPDEGNHSANLTQRENSREAGREDIREESLDNSLELEKEDNTILNEVWAELRQQYAANPEKFLEEWDEDLDGIEPI